MNKRAHAKLFLVIIECQRLQGQLTAAGDALKQLDANASKQKKYIIDLEQNLASKQAELGRLESQVAVWKQEITKKPDSSASSNLKILASQIE